VPALQAFRDYMKLPLALRIRAAEDHVRAIEDDDARDVESGVCASATVRPGRKCRAERGSP
jgi:hypothetical protein